MTSADRPDRADREGRGDALLRVADAGELVPDRLPRDRAHPRGLLRRTRARPTPMRCAPSTTASRRRAACRSRWPNGRSLATADRRRDDLQRLRPRRDARPRARAPRGRSPNRGGGDHRVARRGSARIGGPTSISPAWSRWGCVRGGRRGVGGTAVPRASGRAPLRDGIRDDAGPWLPAQQRAPGWTLAFTPSAEFSVWAPVRVAFDRTGVAATAAAAAGAVVAHARLARGGAASHSTTSCMRALRRNRDRPWQALYYLQRVRTRTLALASERHGFDADEFRHVDDLPANERDPLLATLVTDLDRASLLGAIEIATRGVPRRARARRSFARAAALPAAVGLRAGLDRRADQRVRRSVISKKS